MKATGNGAWGFIIRDHAGDHVVVGAGNAGVVLDALMAEVVSCLKSPEDGGNVWHISCSGGGGPKHLEGSDHVGLPRPSAHRYGSLGTFVDC